MPLKEYRICMPLTVEEYRIGQLYMISKHSHEQTAQGEGVEVLINDPIDDPQLGHGQYTEKRIHLSSRLPSWIRGLIPRIFYVTEKAWNFYPYTKTEYTCSFLPRFSISIETRYEDNNGSSENDCTKFKSVKTNRGPLEDNWRETSNPIMCSYKAVEVKFEVWGLQTRVEGFVHRAVRDVLLLGHKQAFTWIDEWYGMTIDDIRQYEKDIQAQTNKKVLCPGEKQTVDAAEEAQTTEVIQAAD
ncbi:PREDICTED: cytoplasmic phosphatidylinositol transfer protein 1-like isoform X2 [Priapulus caudatus]|uniref:Cytoplasmic phosphatidylinositol transfer protein 1-like isoform X2 n=1 Tax=Priapulus caudatus TaxID=37621 RepID=A0ABM1EPH7_PRICU|nr:PREDICTED: cytoplasmic phosphatidylinositol transfer protein 1-like isoform X2 [Priapulus caudatus]